MDEDDEISDIESWWEIPSIVHFCKNFSPVCTDLCPVDINEFERAIKANSGLMTNMAIRFIKICGFYDPNSNKWWTIMKQHFKEKCSKYNFQYSLDSVIYFDFLSRKQKVEALYILCHLILDVETFQYNISLRPELCNKMNVKPLGYDLNKSLYWYFGSTRLYREDFENTADLSTKSSISNDNRQLNCSVLSNNSNLSNIDSHDSFSTEPYPLGGFRTGKWHIVCDDNYESWYSLADITEHSKHVNIRSLHKSICNIIQELPQIKRKKSHYTYIKSPASQLYLKHNINTRSLRSLFVNEVEDNELETNSDIKSQNVNQTKNNDMSLISQLNKRKHSANMNNMNVYENKNKQIENSIYETKQNLRYNHISAVENGLKKKKCDKVYVECSDQENAQKLNNFKQKLRTSKRFKSETEVHPFKDLNC